ncbi:MAG: hypothetical protein P4L84_24295 [Isosphaeraceae bacterium]|nr:hypothetical protein [Isosphaeraceae bacterium]
MARDRRAGWDHDGERGAIEAQARIYNHATGGLPGIKPASAAEIARRYQASDPGPGAKFYAERDGALADYAVFNPNGRISYPWCLPDAPDLRAPLLEAVRAGQSARVRPRRGRHCFRLGAMGTESERHKRVNGMFSVVFRDEADGATLLAEVVRRFERDGLTHVAAQSRSDATSLTAFDDRYFERQGSFPIYARRLDAGRNEVGPKSPLRLREGFGDE